LHIGIVLWNLFVCAPFLLLSASACIYWLCQTKRFLIIPGLENILQKTSQNSVSQGSGIRGFPAVLWKIPEIIRQTGHDIQNPHALHRCLASVYNYTGKGCDQQKEMMYSVWWP
jgi:hypothetical protein